MTLRLCTLVAVAVTAASLSACLPDGFWDSQGDDGDDGASEGEGEGDGGEGEGEGEGEGLRECCDVDVIQIDAPGFDGTNSYSFFAVSALFAPPSSGQAPTWNLGFLVSSSDGNGSRYATTYGALDESAGTVVESVLFTSGVTFGDFTGPILGLDDSGPTIVQTGGVYHDDGNGFAGPEDLNVSSYPALGSSVFGRGTLGSDGSAVFGLADGQDDGTRVVAVARRFSGGSWQATPPIPAVSGWPPLANVDADGVVHAVVVGDFGPVSYSRFFANEWHTETVPNIEVDPAFRTPSFTYGAGLIVDNISLALRVDPDGAQPVIALTNKSDGAVHLLERNDDGDWLDCVVDTSDGIAIVGQPLVAVDDDGAPSIVLYRQPTANTAVPSLRLFRDDGTGGFDQTVLDDEVFAPPAGFAIDGDVFRVVLCDSPLRFYAATPR